jgi:putative two-component system response regulator
MTERILVVDDQPLVREVLALLLEREGYIVRQADSGEAALADLEVHPPDMILLDVTLPGMSGIEVCRRVRRRDSCDLLPIALITGMSDSLSRIRGLEAGADDFVSKPFEPEVLLARIRALLRVKRLTDQLERTENVIFAIARTVEARDAYTDAHLWRMAEYSRRMAGAFGASAEETRYAWYGGLLHDIGKIGIDDQVLRKPGALTEAEFDQIKRHPDMGANIVSSLRFAPVVAPIIRSHHERWDGRGYPQGLSGEEIPFAARIVAVADAWDAMTTDRPYRPALPHEEAMRRLRRGSGEQWDPTMVELFLRLLERGELESSGTRATDVA